MLNKGLVALWNFNGDAKDFTPYTNNGVITGATLTTDRFNTANKSYSFDGTNGNFIEVPHNPVLNPSDMTISVWINPTAWSSPTATSLLSKRSNTVNGWTILFIGTGTGAVLAIDFNDGTTQNRWTTAYNPPTGVWTHIVITNSSAGREIFINGVSYLTTTPKGGVDTTSAVSLYFGKNRVDGTQLYNGKIGETRIYKRALSATEVTQLYNTYGGNYHIGSLEKGLVLDMPLGDYQQNNKMTDRTPYNNNGTKNGTVGLSTNRFNETNKAISLDGVSGKYIECANNPSLDNITTNMTLSAWIYVNSGSDSGYIISKNNLAFNDTQYSLYWGATGISAVVNTNQINSGAGTAPVNTWLHVAFTYNGANAIIYINGVGVANTAIVFSNPTNNYLVNIGRRHPDNFIFNGKISDVKIWNRALSATEVKTLYEKKSLL